MFNIKDWKYPNTTLLIVSLLVFFIVLQSETIRGFIINMGSLGYLGAFITGFFFVSTFTVAPAGAALYYFGSSSHYHPLEIALLAGLGSVLGDYIIFRFLKDRIFEEISPLFKKYVGSHLSGLLKTPYFSWFSPVLGALIIVSPFPDEMGIGLLGLSKIKTWQFLFITFVLDFIGTFLIVGAARIFTN